MILPAEILMVKLVDGSSRASRTVRPSMKAVSDLHFFYVAAGAAADDFDIGVFDVAEGDLRAVAPLSFCKVFDGECMLLILVGAPRLHRGCRR